MLFINTVLYCMHQLYVTQKFFYHRFLAKKTKHFNSFPNFTPLKHFSVSCNGESIKFTPYSLAMYTSILCTCSIIPVIKINLEPDNDEIFILHTVKVNSKRYLQFNDILGVLACHWNVLHIYIKPAKTRSSTRIHMYINWSFD